jgi:hypothetical protein
MVLLHRLELCRVEQLQRQGGFAMSNTLRHTVVRSGFILLLDTIANIFKLLGCLQKNELFPEVLIDFYARMTPTLQTGLLGVYKNQPVKMTAKSVVYSLILRTCSPG